MQTLRLPLLERSLIALMVLVVMAIAYGTWRDDYFWQTPDQRGYAAYEQGEYASAERHFQNPLWKAAACYRRGDFKCAAEIYSTADGANAAYNLGNALAHTREPGSLTTALASYQKALAQRPDWTVAKHNQQVIAELLIAQQAKRKSGGDGEAAEPSQTPDGTVVDDKAKHGQPGEVMIEKLNPNAVEQLWLRNVKTDPAAFLRLRFASERAASSNSAKANP